MQHAGYAPAGRVPKFADHLSLSFRTPPRSARPVSAIKRWAKPMMITEAPVPLVLGVPVVAR